MVNQIIVAYSDMCFLLFPILSILVNIFAALYIDLKFKKRRCGVRVLLTNQILANSLALFCYALVPTPFTNLSLYTRGVLCKIFPGIGFLCCTVSIINIAVLLFPGDYSHRDGRTVWKWSTKTAWLVVGAIWTIALFLSLPVMTAGTMIPRDNNDNYSRSTDAEMCTLVWSDDKIPLKFYINCLFLVKYASPLLLLVDGALRQEIQRVKESKTRVILLRIKSILTVSTFLLLLYFFPLSFIGYGPFLSPNRASDAISEFIFIFEISVIANCAIVPFILKLFVDNLLHCEKMQKLGGSDYKLTDKDTKYVFTDFDTSYETSSTFMSKKQDCTLIV